MVPEPESRLEELFHRLAPLSASERAGTLSRECSGNEELRHQLETLLRAHDERSVLDESLDVAGLHVGVGQEVEGDTPRPGDHIGPFCVREVLGSGGMGTVCLAEQRLPVQRRVALKLIRRTHDSEELRRRFEAERQALALLDSPYIARILDIGSTEDGRPFYAMEYVEGVPATIYADRHDLDVRERLDLFLRVCEGIRHAHQKGIIHRDIKPSNVLVVHEDSGPVVKLIDFGIAKLLGPLSGPKLRTQHGVVLGTPEYMSPESATGGRDVDTRSDVYSAGVLLYEMLSGRLPRARHDTDGFRREATRTFLRGELVWICQKALEEDRADRYQSIAELSDDVRRAMTHQPVMAGPPSARYRLRKFLRRNRVAVAAAAAVAIVLVAASAVSTSFYLRERQARLAAESERRRSDGVGNVFRRVLSESTISRPDGSPRSTADALAIATDAIEGEASLDERDRTHLRLTLGNLYWESGQEEVARQLLRRALEGFEAMADPDAHEHAECLVSLANIAANSHDPRAAKDYAHRALDRVRDEYGPQSLESLVIHVKTGQVLAKTDARDDAVVMLRQAQSLGRATIVHQVNEPNLARTRIAGLMMLQRTLLETGGLREAEDVLREAHEVWQATGLMDARTRLEFHKSRARLAGLFQRWPEASAAYDSTVALYASINGNRHYTTVFYSGRLAHALAHEGRFDRSDSILAESLRWCEENPAHLARVRPMLLWFRAEVSRARGQLDLALQDYDRAWQQLPEVVDNPRDEWYARVDLGRGCVHLARGDAKSAEQCFSRAYDVCDPEQDTVESLELAYWLARARVEQGRYQDAEPLALKAYRGLRPMTGETMPSTVQAGALIESLYTAWNRPIELQAWRERDVLASNRSTADTRDDSDPIDLTTPLGGKANENEAPSPQGNAPGPDPP